MNSRLSETIVSSSSLFWLLKSPWDPRIAEAQQSVEQSPPHFTLSRRVKARSFKTVRIPFACLIPFPQVHIFCTVPSVPNLGVAHDVLSRPTPLPIIILINKLIDLQPQLKEGGSSKNDSDMINVVLIGCSPSWIMHPLCL